MSEIKTCHEINGKGVYTTEVFREGDVVVRLQGPIVDQPTRESIEIGPGQHIIDPIGSYVNHSFTPTTKVEGRGSDGVLIALTNLSTGRHVTFNYNDSETSMACPFQVGEIPVSGNSRRLKFQ